MFSDKDAPTQPKSEIQLSLDDLHHFIDLMMNEYDEHPNEYDKELTSLLLDLWKYYARKTKNTGKYYLTIKREP